MKNAITNTGSKLLLMAICLIYNIQAFAQDAPAGRETKTTVTSHTTTNMPDPAFWNNPTVWIIGGVVLILIIIAIMASRGNSGNNQVSRSTTTTSTLKVD